MSARKQTLICPRCKTRVGVALTKYFARYKDYSYISISHPHDDNNLYVVKMSPTGKVVVSAWRGTITEHTTKPLVAVGNPRGSSLLRRLFGR